MTGPAARPARLAGLMALPVRLRWLIGAVVTLGVAAEAVAVVLAFHGPATTPVRLLATLGLVIAGHSIRLPVRVGGSFVRLSWGEAAIVLGLCIVPPAWFVALFPVGLLVSYLARPVALVKATYNLGGLTLSASAGVLAAVALGGAGGVPPLTQSAVLALCVASVVYTIGTAAFTATAVAWAEGDRIRTLLSRTALVSALMLVGNVAVGLLVAAVGLADLRWLVFLPPLLWLLHEVYRGRLQAGEQQRIWRELAAATRRLGHAVEDELDERGVVAATAVGVHRLLGPCAVEIVVRTDDAEVHYVAETADGPVTIAEGLDDSAAALSLDLAVGDQRVGEMRLRFHNQVVLDEPEQHALSTFVDAVAGALYNAIARGRLGRLAEHTTYHAQHDSLTGLANRAKLLASGDDAMRALAESGTSAAVVALLLLDLDHFKEVNDTLGHDAGDDLLRSAAGRLAAAIAPEEVLARLGGDEFALFIGGQPDADAAAAHAESRARHLAAELARPTEIASVTLSVEVSIGIVCAPAGSCEMTELLRRADVAMYQAKRSGSTVAAYDVAKDAASTDRLALLAELREALADEDQLVLVLQPAVDLVTGAPIGAEALVRWNHPRRGLLAPAEFIGAVEQSELIASFTRYVIDRALTVAAQWSADGLEIPVAVNLSARSLLDKDLPGDVRTLLAKHGVEPARLVLEITETVMMSELETIDVVLSNLRDVGVKLAVDDFGTGYSSLTFLARFPVDEVKVDRAFVARMVESPEAAAIVRTTVELARALGLRVVAEGVETADQRAALSAIGCAAAQGFHFFPPMPAEKAGAVLSTLLEAAQARAKVIPLAGRAHIGGRHRHPDSGL